MMGLGLGQQAYMKNGTLTTQKKQTVQDMKR